MLQEVPAMLYWRYSFLIKIIKKRYIITWVWKRFVFELRLTKHFTQIYVLELIVRVFAFVLLQISHLESVCIFLYFTKCSFHFSSLGIDFIKFTFLLKMEIGDSYWLMCHEIGFMVRNGFFVFSTFFVCIY